MRAKPRLSRSTNMAAGDKRRVALAGFVLCFLAGHAASEKVVSFETMSTWATALSKRMGDLMGTITGYHAVDRSYNNDSHLQNVTFEAVKEEELVKKMSEKLSKMLSKKMDALWNLVHAAEEAAKNYSYNPNLKKGEVPYNNTKDMGDVVLDFNSHFSQEVNLNVSSVHIPVEIYDGDIAILNGLAWTTTLDKMFKENYQKDPQILWQFFGSQTGFMRTFPSSRWNLHNQVDLFDVRRQSWYTQGSSSPKDMMILIDTSGSTHGQALQLMKNAVKSILDTLGENDFVNIVEFAQEASFVSDCFNHTAFVQANYRNKKQLEKDVDNLKALGQANYDKGLIFAFERFKEFSENQTDDERNMGANCNKVIILLTDGGTDNAEEVFKEYNWPNKSVRVFTYAVGPTATPVAAIKWMACANRGFFSEIPAMGAIRARVQDYLEVMGRPLALSYVEHTAWTSSHNTPLTGNNSEYTHYLKQGMAEKEAQFHMWEITVEPREYIPVLSRPQVLKNAKPFEWGNIYKDHLGLGMMTTVTLPVYNRTLGSSNQTILGVMGIDVPTTELGKRTPYIAIGPIGYAFAINPNGYAVFHPNLKPSGRYMKDPPNIDLLELELENENDNFEKQLPELRNMMIEGKQSKMVITRGLFLSPDKKYVTRQEATYAFTNITNTTFRLGLSVPKNHLWYPYFKSATNIPTIDLTESPNSPKILIAPWEYLGTLPQQEKLDSSLKSLVEALKTIVASNLTEDQLQLLHHLALDMNIGLGKWKLYVVDMKQMWNSDNSTNSTSQDDAFMENHGINRSDVLVQFIAMNGGVTGIYPPSEVNQFDNDLDLTNSTYYKRSMYSQDYIFSVDSSSYNKTHPAITVSRSITIKRNNHKIAVVGGKLDAEALRVFTLKVMGNSSRACSDDADSIVCYLVDDGGFLISSNQDNSTFAPGKFLGEADPQLWDDLVKKDVYGRSVQYDFQAMCKVKKDTVSAGHRSFRLPSTTLLFEVLTSSWWTSKFAWAYSSFNIYSWIFGDSSVYGEDDDASTEEADEECVLAYQQFYRKQGADKLVWSIDCGLDAVAARTYQLELVAGTNLLLIVAPHPCSKFVEPVKHEPFRIQEDEEKELVCDLSRHPHKRVLSYGCYDNDPKEDESKCDASSLAAPHLLSITAASMAVSAAMLLTTDLR